MRRLTVALLIALPLLFGACRKESAPPTTSPVALREEPPPSPSPSPPSRDALPESLAARIRHYKASINSGRYSEGLAEIENLLSDLEEFVRANPKSAEGNLELAGAYATWMFVAAKLPPGREALTAMVQGVDRDYVGRAIRALDAFDTYSDPNDSRREAAAKVRRLLDDIRREVTAKSGTSHCSEAALQLCRRVEAGEPPAKVFGTVRVDEMMENLQACTECGTFRRIESEVLPAAKKMREVLQQLGSERH